MRTLQLCVFWAWIHDSDFRAGAPIGLSGSHVLGMGSAWLIIPSEDMGELLAEAYGQLTNQEWTCISWEWWEPSTEAVTVFKKNKNPSSSIHFSHMLTLLHRISVSSSVQTSLLSSPLHPCCEWTCITWELIRNAESQVLAQTHWIMICIFTRSPGGSRADGWRINYRLSFPLLSQFLYYADNLVSHQPERIPPLQREGGDVLSTTRLFWWAKVEDIRTLEC